MARIRYYDPDTQEWLLADAGGDENVQSDWKQSNTAADDYIKNKPILATVATTGDYSDLNGRPTYSVVASTGKYNDLMVFLISLSQLVKKCSTESVAMLSSVLPTVSKKARIFSFTSVLVLP